METTLEDVKKVLAANLNLAGIEWDKVGGDTPLFDSGLGLDSLDAIELVTILRKNFDIAIDNMEDGRRIFQTLGTLRAYIERERKK
ncbi:MAG: phosphopantetheine-binding protein [Verrucomicrobiales bacterium]|jgi:acyl carrier protein|nr:phosphopantetheine-binding protein [Verrucomicrobiales bacterium]